MRNKSFYFLLFSVAMALAYSGFAQEAQPAEMADAMRSSGKIYVVIAVILTILAGLIFYVARLDRKISKLEKGE
jgi:prolipoprotein diacylglyceryltransferase